MTHGRPGSRAAPLHRRYASLVKLEHTIFALPFAYAGAILAGRGEGVFPSWSDLLWITVAMAAARSLAMAINRLVDREIDARNPRTAGRELPRGALAPAQVAAFCLFALALYLLAVFQLAPVVRYLCPIPVIAFLVYPYLKRVTWLCHLWLGATIGLAPLAAWLALGKPFAWAPCALWLAVASWIAGFDMLYALYDLEVDQAQRLHSVAARFGVVGAFRGARILHVATVTALVLAGVLGGAGSVWYAGAVAVAALLLYEHLIVSPSDLRRLDAAFFTANSFVAVVFLAFVIGDAL